MRKALWLLPATWLSACASAAEPAPVQPAVTVTPVAEVASVPTVSAAPEPTLTPSNAPATANACLGSTATLDGKYAKKTVDAGLATKLATCGGAAGAEQCRYDVAKAYFAANYFVEAGKIFGELAEAGPNSETGIFAAQLHLECLNVLGSQGTEPRPDCYDVMATVVPHFRKLYCAAPGKTEAEFCTTLLRIDGDIQRLAAEKLVQKADRLEADGPERLSLFKKAGETYMTLFDAQCAFRRPDPKHKAAAPAGWDERRCSEIAFNAMRAFQAGHEMGLSDAARAALLDPQNQLNNTALAKKAAGK